MALDWSPHYNELLLAAYGRMGGAWDPSNVEALDLVDEDRFLTPAMLYRMTDGVGGGGGGNNGYESVGAAGEQPDGLVLVWSLGLPSR